MHYHTVYIGVNYKTPLRTIEWANSILTTNPSSLVVVVDNSRNDNPHLKEELGSTIMYVDTGSNLGYFNGAAFGLHRIEQIHSFDWVVVSNVDLVLKTEKVDEILDDYKKAAVVAPGIISYDTGFDKNPYRINRPTKRSVEIKKIAFSNAVTSKIYVLLSRYRNSIIQKKHLTEKKCDEGSSIYLPYGAVMFFSKQFFTSGCIIDFPLFLFGEELYVAEQVYKEKLDIIYVPSIEFINFEHASTSHLNSNSVNKRNFLAMKYILDNYYN